MSPRTDILIIGGGVIGMAAARELSGRGAQVTVIDKGQMGYGCSYGNAGWLTPCFALPLPMPGMLLKSIGWLLDPESPLYIKPSPDFLLTRWLIRFLRSMNGPLMARSVQALTAISKYSLDAYAGLAAEFPQIAFEKRGLLMVGQSLPGVQAAVQEMELVAKHGIPGRVLNESQVHSLEPSLTGAIRGGVYFPEEAHAEPLQIVKAMAEAAVKNGATIIAGAEVFDFHIAGRQIRGVRTTRGEMKADQYILATGAWSHSIAKRLKLRIPVLGGKGYAVIVPSFSPGPKIPMLLVERKIAVTPRGDSVRLAGTLELVNEDDSITSRRVDAILAGTRQFLSLPENPEVREIWRGLRPCTPDGVPIIGYTGKYENLLLATGHQMLGLQSAPGTGRLAADLILKATPTFDPTPFRADRF
ncbi:MAG: FAD-dependent oxidoreductase [Verrucomicrobia bacterium]|nr:FAD-dependent oxidoreductase [Verrucomicrobiota bacterium]